MNFTWPRFLKSAYRREPISSFVLTMGAVDAVMGGVGDRATLLAFGISLVCVAIALRWWQSQRSAVEEPARVPELYLPSRSSRPQLPSLSAAKKHPPY